MSLSDLIALRSLHKKPVGIDLQRLNKGEKKKKKKKTSSTPKTAEEKWAEQLAKGGLVSREMEDDEDAEEGEAEATQSKRIVRQNNFQGETGTLDVDKHMMAYIEEEMRKRRGGEDLGSLPTASQVKASFNNPEDELYQVAEKYRQLQNKNKTDLDKEEEEGNVTLSASMLSSIPEIDLGMDARLKNIEETEKAKRAFYESRKAGGGEMRRHEDDQLAAARFFRPRYQARSDADASRVSRAFPNGPSAAAATSSNQAGEGGGARRKVDRREMASDQLVMDRFKKRQRNFK
ncbi:hypothetical protein IE53DRAFT_373285 [Violaceomyces palustris]|uniref:Uncharacterized protein n=1 Tax=Violaceomyces palustris TaxID=1673888 RepID=A0ACD0P4T2_9BASI|nr:hypothetical protein IE53DRAFT_373285 [Violaceomyces palustris]